MKFKLFLFFTACLAASSFFVSRSKLLKRITSKSHTPIEEKKLSRSNAITEFSEYFNDCIIFEIVDNKTKEDRMISVKDVKALFKREGGKGKVLSLLGQGASGVALLVKEEANLKVAKLVDIVFH